MLGKLIKHDLKSTSKIMIPINLVLIVTTLIGCILLKIKLWEIEGLFPIFITLLIAYLIMISTVLYLTLIYLSIHYYRNMFSSQGYLTFTLPVSSWTLLNSRFITGFFWYTITGIVTFSSIGMLLSSAYGFSNFFSWLYEIIFLQQINLDGFTYDLSYTTEFIFGFTPAQLLFLFLLLALVSSFSSVAMGYGSITIGQLYAKHKIAGSILAYIGIYFLVQVITTAVIFTISFSNTFCLMYNNSPSDVENLAFYRSVYGSMIPVLLILSLVLGIVCYVISGIIIKKKVNLD